MASELARHYAAHYVEDAARVLEARPATETSAFLAGLAPDDAGRLLAHLLPAAARACLGAIPAQHAGATLNTLPHAQALRLLALVGREPQRAILEAMPAERRQLLQHAMRYPEDSIGTVVIPNPPCARSAATVRNTKRLLRRHPLDEVPVITVLDDQGRPIGLLNVGALLRLSDRALLADHMRPPPVRVQARADLSTAVRLRAWLSEDYLPVTDAEGIFVGMLAKTAVYQHLLLRLEPGDRNEEVASALVSLAELMWRPGAELLAGATAPGTGDSR